VILISLDFLELNKKIHFNLFLFLHDNEKIKYHTIQLLIISLFFIEIYRNVLPLKTFKSWHITAVVRLQWNKRSYKENNLAAYKKR
jgi:hypothetical protein